MFKYQPNTYLLFLFTCTLVFLSSCSEEGEPPAPLVQDAIANFDLSRSEIYVGDTIEFSDKSTGAVAWNWAFQGGTPNASTEQNLSIIYTNPGEFKISLNVSNSANKASAVRVQTAVVKDNKIPPYDGTIFLDPDIVTAEDPTTYQSITYDGRKILTLLDRRAGANQAQEVNAFAYTATYERGKQLPIYVNPEFSEETAGIHAAEYARLIGQMPAFLFDGITIVNINDGLNPWGGGGGLLLIHTKQGEDYRNRGIMVETMIHEAGHASISYLDEAPEYQTAAGLDPTFISTYARDNPLREDIAETILLYLAYRYRPERVSDDLIYTCSKIIPNRMAFFDEQNFDVYPWKK